MNETKELTYPLAKIGDFNKYGKIFDSESPDINMMDLLKQSVKSGKPFVVVLQKDMLSEEQTNMFLKITDNMVKKALQDDDCDSVNVVYLKQK